MYISLHQFLELSHSLNLMSKYCPVFSRVLRGMTSKEKLNNRLVADKVGMMIALAQVGMNVAGKNKCKKMKIVIDNSLGAGNLLIVEGNEANNEQQ